MRSQAFKEQRFSFCLPQPALPEKIWCLCKLHFFKSEVEVLCDHLIFPLISYLILPNLFGFLGPSKPFTEPLETARSLPRKDRVSIHEAELTGVTGWVGVTGKSPWEAMEQQTISIAKAGMTTMCLGGRNGRKGYFVDLCCILLELT